MKGHFSLLIKLLALHTGWFQTHYHYKAWEYHSEQIGSRASLTSKF